MTEVIENPEVVVEPGNELGEGPIWDYRSHSLYWLDIIRGELHRFVPKGNTHSVFSIGRMAGSIHLAELPDKVLLTTGKGILRMNLSTGEIHQVGRSFELREGLRFNDGKTDAMGRIWAGAMELHAKAEAGLFMRICSASQPEIIFEGITIPNGLSWSRDNRTFYHIDSPTHTVKSYPFNLKKGNLGEPVTALVFDDGAVPDGMCMDREGKLWIAFWGKGQVERHDPLTRERLAIIKLPAAQVTSCCFGGEGMQDLYITSAHYGMGGQERDKEPLAGSVFRVHLDIGGWQEPLANIV